jgi:hypothetical protein
MTLTLKQITRSLLVKSFERATVHKAALSRTPLVVRVSSGDDVDVPKSFEVFPVIKTDGTNREVLRWVIHTSLYDIDVTEDIVAYP